MEEKEHLVEEQALADYIKENWPWFEIEIEKPLREIFPMPDNPGLKHIWKHGHADVLVKHHNIPVCIYEPGGSHHFDEKQARNDRRKYMLCKKNDCECIHMVANIDKGLSQRKYRQLIRKGLASHL